MTIASQTNRVAYTGNGATVDFAVAFPFQSANDLVVIETVIATGVQTTKTITTHYTVSGTPDSLGYYPDGGTVTAVTAPASTVRWTIYRDPDLLQGLNLSENNALPAESVEAQLDLLTMMVQRLSDRVDRSLRQPDGDSANLDVMPTKVDRASLVLGFDADGDPIPVAVTGDVGTALPISGGTLTGNLTVRTSSAPLIKIDTTHATNFAAQLQFLVSGTTKFMIATDINQVGTNDLTFYDGVSGTVRLAITDAGVISLPIGQLKFPATQNASADANTLDDYEEGAWTPSVGGTATYTVQDGQYVKIGKLVTVTCQMTINVIGTGSTALITGLPFARGAAYMNATGAVYFTSLSQNVTTVVALTNNSTTDVALYSLTAAGASLGLNAILGNGSVICFTLTYRASA